MKSELTSGVFRNRLPHLEILDISAGFEPSMFFTLDDHLSFSGHQYVAEQLVARIGCLPMTTSEIAKASERLSHTHLVSLNEI